MTDSTCGCSCGTGTPLGNNTTNLPLAGDPNSPSGLAAVGKYGYIEVTWQMPTLNPGATSFVQIWRSRLNDVSTATHINSVSGTIYNDPHEDTDTDTYYFWISLVSIHGTQFPKVGPVSAHILPSIEKILQGLTAKIDSGILAQSLRSEIERIASLDTNIAQETLNRLAENTALSQALALVQSDLGEAQTLIQNEIQARTDDHTAIVTSLNTLAAGVSGNASAIIQEQQARADAVSAVASSITTLDARTTSAEAAIIAESTTRAGADSALSQSISSLVATVDGKATTAALTSEQQARVAGDTALASSITTLESRTTTAEAAIQSTSQTLANSNSAQASTNTQLSASISGKGKVIYSSTAPAVADRLAQNLWIDTTNGANTPKMWNGTAWLAVTDKVAADALAKANTAAADIITEANARASADNVLANQITQVQTTLGGNIASVQQTLQANIDTTDGKVNAIGALYTLKVNVNGLVGGFGVYNDGTTVEAGFDVDKFWIGRTSGDKKKPFIISNGVVYLDSAVIQTLGADKIDTRNLTIKDSAGNVVFSSGVNLDYSRVAGATKPIQYQLGSRGASAVTYPADMLVGVKNLSTNTTLGVAARSYTLTILTRSTGAVVSSTGYDVYGAGALQSGRDAAALATALNAATGDQLVIITTTDEPMTNRLTGGLDTAMYRCGASRVVFGSPNFKGRSAYILIGVPGCGEGSGFEAYAGDVTNDPVAWCSTTFSIQNGQVTIGGASKTPSSLSSYGYTGDLNATYGAPGSSPVGSTTASALVTLAGDAKTNADSALQKLNNIASDGVLTAGEKPQVIHEYWVITNEQSGLEGQATTNGVTTQKTDYATAITALTTYLNTLTTPTLWNSTTGDTTVVAATFWGKFQDVYTKRQLMLNAMVANAKASTTAAASAASAAQQTADDAVQAASDAASSAQSALDTLTTWGSDNQLSPVEKPGVVQLYNTLITEQTGIDTQANTAGIANTSGTKRYLYNAAISALTTYLGTLTGWNVIPGTSVAIVGTTFRQKFLDAYAARQELLNLIAEKASQTATWSGTSGRPKLYRVISSGYVATAAPAVAGLWDMETNTRIYTATLAYNVIKIQRSTATIVEKVTFNTLAAASNADSMATYLNALTTDYYVVICTSDEPKANRTTANLLAAMKRCGASSAIYGSANFKTRGAYILIGVPGCGEGNGTELYAGMVDSDANAWCEIMFYIQNGTLVTSGSNSFPKFLTDYGYVGDLDATKGAPEGTYVGTKLAESLVADTATALTAVTNIGSDNVLTTGEKSTAIQAWNVINNNKTAISNNAISLGLSVESGVFLTAVTTLETYLTGLSPAWNDTAQNTTIVGTTWRSQWQTFYAAQQTIFNQMFAKAATLATWTGIGGTGKPEDNATVGANATNLAITLGGDNLIQNSDFENRNGNTPYGFNTYNNGGTPSMVASTGVTGSGFGIKAGATPGTTLGLTTGNSYTGGGVVGGVEGLWLPGATYVVSFYAKKVNGAGFTNMKLAWNTAPTSTVALLNPALTTSYQRYAFRITMNATVENLGTLFITPNGTIATNDEMHFDRLLVQKADFLEDWRPSRRDLVNITGSNAPSSILNSTLAPDIAAAGTTATWSGVTGTGRPADNATKNTVTYSATAPTSPTDGDLWCDQSTNPWVIKMRIAGAWQGAANYSTATSHLLDDANLGKTSLWSGVSGTGKPADNANNTWVDANGAIQGVSSGAGTAVSNSLIKVGGTNLWKNSTSAPAIISGTGTSSLVSMILPDGSTGNAARIANTGATTLTVRIYNAIRANDTYSVSFWHKEGTATNWAIDVCDANATSVTGSTSWTQFKKENAVVTNYSTAIYNFIDLSIGAGLTVDLWHPKCEVGNKCSDWTPAPEDITASVAAAKSAADAAQNDATAANAELDKIGSDSWLSPGEKPNTIQKWNVLSAEQSILTTRAAAYNQSTTAYTTALASLQSYLLGLSPAWSDLANFSPIDPVTWRGLWETAYNERNALLINIANEAGKRAEWLGLTGKPDTAGNAVCKSTFEDGTTGRWTGSSVACVVLASPGTAWAKQLVFRGRDTLEIGSDFAVTAGEVLYVSADVNTAASNNYNSAIGVMFTNSAGANTWLGVSVPKSTVYTKITGALTVPAGYIKATPWLQIDGPAAQTTDQVGICNIYIGKQELGSTRNNVTYSGVAPLSPNNGDIWIDTSTTPVVNKIRVAGAWVVSANKTTELSGSGVNYMNPRYQSFGEANLPPVSVGNGTATRDATQGYFGNGSLKLVASANDNWCYLSSGSTDFNFSIQPNSKWIVSFYVKSSTASAQGEVWWCTGNGSGSIYFNTSATANSWTRINAFFDKSSDGATLACLRLDNNTSGVTMWFDGIMVEPQLGTLTLPSPFNASPNFLEQYTGALDATKNSVTTAATAPASPTNGDIWIDMSSSPSVTKVRIGGAWVIGASYVTNTNQIVDGAGLGSTAAWSGVTGTGRPADNATKNTVTYSATAPTSPTDGDIWVDTSTVPTVTRVRTGGAWVVGANNTTEPGGTGVNHINPRYQSFSESSLPPVEVTNGTATLDTGVGYFGSNSLKLVAATNDTYCYLSSASPAANISIQPNRKWIWSMYVRASVVSASVEFIIRTSDGVHSAGAASTSATANTWTRVSGVIDLTANASTLATARIDNNTLGASIWYDGLMLEPMVGNATAPSPFSASPNFLEQYTGALDATKNSVISSPTAPINPVNGDIWIDTLSTPNLTKVRVAGAWVVGANYVTSTSHITDDAGLGNKALWEQVGGSNKPADNATKNVVTYSATAPTNPSDGDLWGDQSVNPWVIRMRVGGAWQIAANLSTDTIHLTDGANLGKTALWAGIPSGSGKPADNATNNPVYVQSATPTGSEGAVWVDTTNASVPVTKIYKSGAWTIGANKTTEVGGSGVNYAHPRYSNFEESSLPPVTYANCAVALDTTTGMFGSNSLKIYNVVNSDGFCYLNNNGSGLFPIPAGQKWILSAYVKVTSTASLELMLFLPTSNTHIGGSTTVSSTTWQRISYVLDLSAYPDTSAMIRLDNNAGSCTAYFDGIMLEPMIGTATTPSPYQKAPNFLETYIGALDANKTYVDSNGLLQGVSSGAGTQVDNSKLVIGGANLWKNSEKTTFASVMTGTAGITTQTVVLPDNSSGTVLQVVTTAATALRVAQAVRSNGAHSISLWHRTSSGTAAWSIDICDAGPAGGGSINSTTTWQQYKSEGTVISNWSTTYNFIDINLPTGVTLWLWHPQCEYGNKCTNWSPAVEDTAAALTAAQTTADNAINELNIYSNDSYLSKVEKKGAIDAWNAIWAEKDLLANQATALGVSPAAYTGAITTLQTYLDGLSPSWSNVTTNTPINPTTWRTNWTAVYSTKQALLSAINAAAATRADWTSVQYRPDSQGNMVRKSSFEDGSKGQWTGSLNVEASSGTAWAKRLYVHGRDHLENGSDFPVTPGETIWCAADMCTSASSVTATLGLQIKNSAGTVITWIAGASLTAGNSWRRVEGKLTIPANAVAAVPWIQMDGVEGQSTAFGWFANISISRSQQGSTVGADWFTNLSSTPSDSLYSHDDGAALGVNGAFSVWNGAYPKNWIAWNGTVTKDTTGFTDGTAAVKMTTAGAPCGIQSNVFGLSAPSSAGSAVVVGVSINVSAWTSGICGALVRIYTNASFTTYSEDLMTVTGVTSGWVRKNVIVQLGNVNDQIYGVRVYLLGSWVGFGADSNLTCAFKNVSLSIIDNKVVNKSVGLSESAGVMTIVPNTTTPGATVTVVNANNKITKVNVGTYMGSAAIGTAYIDDLAVTNAKVGNILKSNNFNGIVDEATGVISTGGTQGWAIGKAGQMVVDAAHIRGQLTASQISTASLSAVSANLGTATAGRIQNPENTNFVNLNASGSSDFLRAGNGLVRITADGRAFFTGTKTPTPLTWTGSVPVHQVSNFVATSNSAVFWIDTGINIVDGTDDDQNYVARNRLLVASHPGYGVDGNGQSCYLDIDLTVAIRSPLTNNGYNPYGAGNKRLMIRASIRCTPTGSFPMNGSFNLTSMQYVVDYVS